MGYILNRDSFHEAVDKLREEYLVYAPTLKKGEGTFSEIDVVRYDEIGFAEELELSLRSDYSFKEVLLPLSQTLFYFTEDEVTEAKLEERKILIFLRSCDVHGIKRLDEIYMNNGVPDYYYDKVRENVEFALIGCSSSFEDCFCVSMGSNQTDNYAFAVNEREGNVEVDVRKEAFRDVFSSRADSEAEVTPDAVESNYIQVQVPEEVSLDLFQSDMWDEYTIRCINCGRCNFVCPTCTCFSMQDLYYTDNYRAGERRRVAASCMVDGFTDVAGGGAYRKKNGERMRFRVMHKVSDFKTRFGYHMCVGCGRCDTVCPEYISFSTCVNKVTEKMKEVGENVEK